MITVIVATLNRADLLKEGLASLAGQECSYDWRVIVVDNGSKDTTAAVARSFEARDHRFSYLLEPIPGACKARNSGLSAATTRYVLFVDDECTFPPDYLQRACRLCEHRRPACFGGPVMARYAAQQPRPSWYKDVYGSFSLPENNLPGAPPRLSAGNIGGSVAALKQIGGFPEDYGPVAKAMRYGEENALVASMWDTYGPDGIVYDEQLINYHLVRPEKYAWSHILKDNFGRGVARGRLYVMGLNEATRVLLHAANSSDAAAVRKSKARLALDLLLDISLLRMVVDRAGYPAWQNVVFERWMGYVRRIGVLAGLIATIATRRPHARRPMPRSG